MGLPYHITTITCVLTQIRIICEGSLLQIRKPSLRIANKINGDQYEEWTSDFIKELKQANNLLNEIQVKKNFMLTESQLIAVSDWIDIEISRGIRPYLLKKIQQVNYQIPILRLYEDLFLKCRNSLRILQTLHAFTLEAEIHKFSPLMEENAPLAHELLDNIRIEIESEINNLGGIGGWIEDIDTFRFHFQEENKENIIKSIIFLQQAIINLKSNNKVPEDLTLLVCIGYGDAIRVRDKYESGSATIDARKVMDDTLIIKDKRKISLGNYSEGMICTFLSENAYKEIFEVLKPPFPIRIKKLNCRSRRNVEQLKKIYEIVLQ